MANGMFLGVLGLGHTTSLLSAGIVVIALKVQISERIALWMEFAVALMRYHEDSGSVRHSS